MRRLAPLVLALALAAPLAAQSESSLKAAYVLNREGGAPGFTWLFIQESNYFIKGLVSFGYELQFSFDKTAGAVPAEDVTGYPLNVFFNSKVRLMRRGFVRPFLGVGIGLLTTVKTFSDHYGWDKTGATQAMAGLAFGAGSRASFQIEARVLTASQTGFGARFLVAAGLSY